MKHKLPVVLAFIATGFFAAMFYSQYWQYRDRFDAEGRFFDESQGVVFHGQSGIAWGVLTLLCLGISLVLAFQKR